MSVLTLTKVPDCEALIADDLRTWFDTDQKFSNLFPGVNLKISTDHPFVNLMQQSVPDTGKYDTTGFPCLTVIDTNFNKLVETPVAPETVRLLPSLIDEIKAGGRNKFIMSKQALAELEAAFEGQEFLRAEGYQTLRRTQIAMEIWTTNKVQKDKTFDLVSAYLFGPNRFSQHTDNEVIIEEESVTGEKSGIYNMDFGEILYGGMLRFTCAYSVGYYIVREFTIGRVVEVQVHGMVGGVD